MNEAMIAHLISRGMNVSLYHFFSDEDTATFFLYNSSGKLVGYQLYRPAADKGKKNDPKLGRYFTYLPKEVDGLFGLEQDFGGPLFVVEGIFKAAKLHSLGISSVAVCGSSPKRLNSWFRAVAEQREVIAVGDNDPAGAEFVRIVGRGGQSPVDLDEMSDEEVKCLVQELLNS